MKRNKLLIICTILVLVVTFGILYFRNQNNKLPSDLFNQFGCGRKTLDIRFTDKYCGDYNLYKKDHAAGLI